jgi:hypothetical protein
MQDNPNHIELLLETAAEYSKTSFELIKLKTLDKVSDVVSTIIPLVVVLLILSSFMLFCSLGIAFWLGEMLEKVYYGFLVVAAFYGLVAFILHFILRKWLKRKICNYIIKLALN